METLSEVIKVITTDKVIPRFQLPFFFLRDVVLAFFGLRGLVISHIKQVVYINTK